MTHRAATARGLNMDDMRRTPRMTAYGVPSDLSLCKEHRAASMPARKAHARHVCEMPGFTEENASVKPSIRTTMEQRCQAHQCCGVVRFPGFVHPL